MFLGSLYTRISWSDIIPSEPTNLQESQLTERKGTKGGEGEGERVAIVMNEGV